jgi:hypothetical protein
MTPENQAAARERVKRYSLDEGYVETKGVSYPEMREDEHGEYVRFDDYAALLQQPVTSERCGECAECHHSKGVDKNGICNARFFAGGEYLPCLCTCTFPATEAQNESELRRNPRVNALLVALRSIRDKAITLGGAKDDAARAIEHYITSKCVYPATGARRGQPFKEFLAEQMKDPEFHAAYEQISAEEDAKFAAPGAGGGEQRDSECFCGTELEAGLCPNGHDPVERSDEVVDEVQRRMDAVVEAAVEWHQSGREGDNSWFDKSEALSAAINSLLELRDTSPAPVAEGKPQ